ncbi:MAG: hypothetical protein IPF60_07025 [Betaproteobacteria bacterium]|nr:hypothetical protein [Betaproteobacteria bacterium]
MRQKDFEAAQVSLRNCRARRGRRTAGIVLSFEAQIHWFSGAVREARGRSSSCSNVPPSTATA